MPALPEPGRASLIPFRADQILIACKTHDTMFGSSDIEELNDTNDKNCVRFWCAVGFRVERFVFGVWGSRTAILEHSLAVPRWSRELRDEG